MLSRSVARGASSQGPGQRSRVPATPSVPNVRTLIAAPLLRDRDEFQNGYLVAELEETEDISEYDPGFSTTLPITGHLLTQGTEAFLTTHSVKQLTNIFRGVEAANQTYTYTYIYIHSIIVHSYIYIYIYICIYSYSFSY